MRFTKMQGCGNDYIYVDCFTENLSNKNLSDLAKKVSSRHFGIGSDGLILIERPKNKNADAYMHMFNADGSEGKMCGNGIRCVAKYIYDKGIIPSSRKNTVIETPAGLREIELHISNGKVDSATVSMGIAKITSEIPEKISVNKMNLEFLGIDMGNPHAVYFLEDNRILGDLKNLNLEKIGTYFENHERFPERVNSEFIEKISDSEMNFRVWERGSGETLACGTGATAAVFAGVISGKYKRNENITVHLLGGDLKIKILDNNECLMTGEAIEVFNGEIDA